MRAKNKYFRGLECRFSEVTYSKHSARTELHRIWLSEC